MRRYTAESNPAPPWIFALLSFGWEGAIVISAPFVLRHAGVPVVKIATTSSLMLTAGVCYFLWTPIVDIGLRHRTWIRLLGILAASLSVVAFLQPLPGGVNTFTLLLFLTCVTGFPMKGAVGALALEGSRESRRSSAGGWIQAGNSAGMALGAALIIWVASRYPSHWLAFIVPAIILFPVAMTFLIADGEAPDESTLRRQVGQLWGAIRQGVQDSNLRVGIVLFLSPTGAAAASFLFSGIAVDYKVSASTVAFVTGAFGTALSAMGAVAGGFLCRRFGARIIYAVLGLAVSAAALVMATLPFNPVSYIAGVSVYMAVAGCGFAAFTTLALELIGERNPAKSTWYAIFHCMGALPIAYSVWLNGQGYRLGGPRGLFAADALFEGISSIAILAYFIWIGRANRDMTSLRESAAGAS